MTEAQASVGRSLERSVARVLSIGTRAAVVALGVGVVAMLVAGTSPLAGGPALDLARVPQDLLALRPEGFLWLGLLAVLATPAARVAMALVGFVGRRERPMVVVAAAILAIIFLSIFIGTGTEG